MNLSGLRPPIAKLHKSLTCQQCKTKFQVPPHRETAKYCTRACTDIARKGRVSPWKGKIPNAETREKMSKAKRLSWSNPGYRQHMSDAHKGHVNVSGDKHHNWRGGVTPTDKKIRQSKESKAWRSAVFKRDDFRCLDCGERGGQLNADHIYPFALYPRLRFDLNNGQTLCVACHKKTPTYGYKTAKLLKIDYLNE